MAQSLTTPDAASPAGSQHKSSAYVAPELDVFGDVAELTAGPNNGAIDGLFGGDGGFDTGGGTPPPVGS